MTRISALASAAVLLGALIPAGQACAQANDGWRVSLTPYVWLAGIKGDVGAAIDSPPIPIDAEYPGIMDNLSGAFMGQAEVGYGRFGVIGNVDYLKLSADRTRAGNIVTVSGELETSFTEGSLVAYWRAYDADGWTFDLVAGARYTNVEVEADLTVNNAQVSGSREETWWDPVIGARAGVRLNDRWSLVGYGDVGLGGDSESLWQLYGAVRYSFSDNIAASLGYRYYSVEFSKNDFDYGVDIGGPLIGVTFSF